MTDSAIEFLFSVIIYIHRFSTMHLYFKCIYMIYIQRFTSVHLKTKIVFDLC